MDREPQKLEYARPPDVPSRLHAGIYVIATLGGMFVFAATLILLSLLIWASAIAAWLAGPATYVALFVVFAFALLAGASSFRGSLRHYREKRERVLRQYRMPDRWRS